MNPGETRTNVGRAVASVGAYAPPLRLDRAVAAKARRFSGLAGRKSGSRAVGGWDEDAVTLAVEAARRAAPLPDSAIFASTSAPFFERSHAGLLIDALALPTPTRGHDVSGSRRRAISALLGRGDTLIAAGERRPGRAGAAFHLSQGDGGAAAFVADACAARLLGWASLSHDLVDIYASREHPAPYAYEERFVREVSVARILASTIEAALAKAGLSPRDIHHAAVHEPLPGAWREIAGATELAAPNHAADVAAKLGDLGRPAWPGSISKNSRSARPSFTKFGAP